MREYGGFALLNMPRRRHIIDDADESSARDWFVVKNAVVAQGQEGQVQSPRQSGKDWLLRLHALSLMWSNTYYHGCHYTQSTQSTQKPGLREYGNKDISVVKNNSENNNDFFNENRVCNKKDDDLRKPAKAPPQLHDFVNSTGNDSSSSRDIMQLLASMQHTALSRWRNQRSEMQ